MGFFEATASALYVAGVAGLIAIAYRDFPLYLRIAPYAVGALLAAVVALTAWDVAIYKAAGVAADAAPDCAQAVSGGIRALALPGWVNVLLMLTGGAVILSAVIAARHKPPGADD